MIAQYALEMMLRVALLAASAGAAIEGSRQATEDNARAMVVCFLVSGAMLGGGIGFTRGRSVLKGALLGSRLWPAIAMTCFIATVLYSGSFVITAY